jgi:hypothetical protein
MLYLLILLISFLFGYLLTFLFGWLRTNIERITFAFPLGIFAFSGTCFLFSFLFGVGLSSLITLALFSLICFLLYKKFYKKAKKQKCKFEKLTLIILLLTLFYLELYYMLAFRFDEKGDIIAYNMFYLDMPSHIVLISSFLNQKFPPDSIYLINTPLLYHFISDFYSAILLANGSNIVGCIKTPNFFLLFSLVFSIFLLFKSLSDEKTASLATFLFLFFSPAILNSLLFALGFTKPYIKFGYNRSLNSIIDFFDISSLPFYYFSQSFIYIFAGERSMLLGFPIAIFLLLSMWNGSRKDFFLCSILLGFSIFLNYYVFALTSFFFLFYSIKRKIYSPIFIWLLFSLPQIAYSYLNYGQKKPFGFYFDSEFWVLDENYGFLLNHLIFWIRTIGPILIFSLIGLWLFVKNGKMKSWVKEFFLLNLLIFIFFNIYGITNMASWDVNKLIIYFTSFICIFASYSILRLNRIIAFLSILVLTYPSFYLFFRDFVIYGSYYTLSYNTIYPMLFFRNDLQIAQWIINNTNSSSVFLVLPNATSHPVMLTGRKVLLQRYDFARILSQHTRNGETPEEIKEIADKIFLTANCTLIKKYGINYIFIGPSETRAYKINFSKFDNFQLVFNKTIDGKEFRIYKANCS